MTTAIVDTLLNIIGTCKNCHASDNRRRFLHFQRWAAGCLAKLAHACLARSCAPSPCEQFQASTCLALLCRPNALPLPCLVLAGRTISSIDNFLLNCILRRCEGPPQFRDGWSSARRASRSLLARSESLVPHAPTGLSPICSSWRVARVLALDHMSAFVEPSPRTFSVQPKRRAEAVLRGHVGDPSWFVFG